MKIIILASLFLFGCTKAPSDSDVHSRKEECFRAGGSEFSYGKIHGVSWLCTFKKEK